MEGIIRVNVSYVVYDKKYSGDFVFTTVDWKMQPVNFISDKINKMIEDAVRNLDETQDVLTKE